MGEQGGPVTTFGLHRHVLIAAGIFCLAIGVGIPVAAIILSLSRSSIEYVELFIVIPLSVLYAVAITFRAVRIIRTRVTVSPTTITAYWIRGRPSVFSATRQEIIGIEMRGLPASGLVASGSYMAPYVILREGGGFWLRALTLSARRGGDLQNTDFVDRIRNIGGTLRHAGSGRKSAGRNAECSAAGADLSTPQESTSGLRSRSLRRTTRIGELTPTIAPVGARMAT
jgi:hypothetical protein